MVYWFQLNHLSPKIKWCMLDLESEVMRGLGSIPAGIIFVISIFAFSSSLWKTQINHLAQSVACVSCHILRGSGMPIPRLEPMLEHMQVCGSEVAQLPCWLPRGQQVSYLRWIWGIHCTQATKHASEGIHLGFETRTDITRSLIQSYQWPHKKDWRSPKI